MCSISIDLCHPLMVYSPGSFIEGTAVLALEHELKAKCVKILLEGKAMTKWEVAEKSSETHSRGFKVPYSAEKIYVEDEQLVWIGDEVNKALSTGSHSFEFKFKLPNECPPSYEGHHATIRYSVVVVVERPWKTNKTFTTPFTVCPVFDLNKDDENFKEVDVTRTKNIGLVFFRHGKIITNCKIRKSGFVSGETVEIELNVENNSTRPIFKLDLSLIEKCSCVAYRYGQETTRWHGDLYKEETLGYNNIQIDERKIKVKHQDISIAPRSSHTSTIKLHLPCLVPSFRTSSIVHVAHLIEIKLHAKGTLNNTTRCFCPITIGTVPLGHGKGPEVIPMAEDETDDQPPVCPTYEVCAVADQCSSKDEEDVFHPLFPFFGHLRIEDSPEV